jgi:hypothetical protein
MLTFCGQHELEKWLSYCSLCQDLAQQSLPILCTQFYERELRKAEKLPDELVRLYRKACKSSMDVLAQQLHGQAPVDDHSQPSPSQLARQQHAERRGLWGAKPVSGPGSEGTGEDG